MERLGLISFQASDKTDIFHVAEVWENGLEPSDETLLEIEDAQFESDAGWVTGKVPQFKPVNIAGDNVFIQAWLKGEKFDYAYTVRIYLEYEEAEELENVEEGRDQYGDSDCTLEPQEIHL